MVASSKPPTPSLRNDSKSKNNKVTAGTATGLPSPPSSRSRRSGSISSVDTSKATLPPWSEVDSCPSPSRSQFNLYNGHPSLSRSMKPLRGLRGSSDVPGARALAQVFLSGVTDAVHVMQVPKDVEDDFKYLENIQAVSFMIQQLKAGCQQLESVAQESAAVDRIIDIAELTLAALERLLSLTERLVKPLPDIPTDTATDEDELAPLPSSSRLRTKKQSCLDRSSARLSLAQITIGALESPSTESLTSIPDNVSVKTTSTSKTTVILSILQKARENGLGSLFRSKPTVEDELPLYAPRQSALYYPVDPLNPDVDIELPPLSPDAMNITLSHDAAQMIKLSPTAIIRLLTSKDAIRDPHLIHWFFTTFRFILLPSEVLDLLISRFNESMPDEPMSRQQMRVWCNNHHKIVRPRVINVLIRWLTQFWEPPYDDPCVLNDMQDFVLQQVSASLLPDTLGIAFAQAVKAVRVDGVTRSTYFQQRLQAMSTRRLGSAPFIFCVKHHATNRFPIEAFDSSVGYRALAEQITRLQVEVYNQLPIHAVIRSWLGEKKTGDCIDRLRMNLSEMKKRHKAIGKEYSKLIHQVDRSSNPVLVETLKNQQLDLIKESKRLGLRIQAYDAIDKEISRSKDAAKEAARSVRYFDRSVYALVLHSIMLESEDLTAMAQAIKFWFNVGLLCFELNNVSSAGTIYYAATSQAIARLQDILPSDSETEALHDKLWSIFEGKTKHDEMQDVQSVAFVPRFHIVEKNITHIGQTNSDLMSNNTIHAQNLRVIGKVISAIEATRLYTFSDKNSAVESLIRRHISRFDVADEDKHMNAFYERSLELKPRPSRVQVETPSADPDPQASLMSLPPSPSSIHSGITSRR